MNRRHHFSAESPPFPGPAEATEEPSESEEEGVLPNFFSFFTGTKKPEAEKVEEFKADASSAAKDKSGKPTTPETVAAPTVS